MENFAPQNVHILRPSGNNIEDGSITDVDISPTAGIKASKIDTAGATNVVASVSADPNSVILISRSGSNVIVGIDQSQRDYRNWWESW